MMLIEVTCDSNNEAMHEYKEIYGCHFNQKLLDCAVSHMIKDGSQLVPMSASLVDALLSLYGITLNNNKLLDYVYVANMCKADFMGSSIVDDSHLAKYVKDVIDDEDGYEGIVFNRWLADTKCKEIEIDWEEMI